PIAVDRRRHPRRLPSPSGRRGAPGRRSRPCWCPPMNPNEPWQPAPDRTDAAATVTRDLPVPRVALAIGAHPDDVEFGAGATLAKWAAAVCVVHHLVCTDGSKGTWDPNADTAALVRRRQEVQREAARRLAGVNAGTVV